MQAERKKIISKITAHQNFIRQGCNDLDLELQSAADAAETLSQLIDLALERNAQRRSDTASITTDLSKLSIGDLKVLLQKSTTGLDEFMRTDKEYLKRLQGTTLSFLETGLGRITPVSLFIPRGTKRKRSESLSSLGSASSVTTSYTASTPNSSFLSMSSTSSSIVGSPVPPSPSPSTFSSPATPFEPEDDIDV